MRPLLVICCVLLAAALSGCANDQANDFATDAGACQAAPELCRQCGALPAGAHVCPEPFSALWCDYEPAGCYRCGLPPSQDTDIGWHVWHISDCDLSDSGLQPDSGPPPTAR